MAKLIVLQDGEATEHQLRESETVLGRHPECDLQINSNMVSRKHARIWNEGANFLIADLGSGNGTFVNGKKIETPHVLQHQDRIKLGPVLIRFEGQIPVAAPSPGSSIDRVTSSGFSADDSVEDDPATIMGTSAPGMGFGQLQVRPEIKLKAVLEISRALAGTVKVDDILPRILNTLFEIFPHADRGSILLKHAETGRLVPRCTKHRRGDVDDEVRISRTILKTVLDRKEGVLSADATSDSRFQASESISNLTIRSMMCVPMLNLAGEPVGIINIDTQNPFNQFQSEDLDLLVAVAGQAALSFESAQLMVSYLEKQKQDREMGIAADVQRALLPTELPVHNEYEFYASYDSAQAVGGDYYDCFELPNQRICLAFGDVAGKGVPASLVMSRLSSVVTNTMTFLNDVVEAANQINFQMCAKAVEGRFVTFVLLVLDLPTGSIHWVNAGHMPLMLCKVDGTVEELGDAQVGVPLGVMEGFPYESTSHVLKPGETVVIYTDGVSEAMNHQSELYGVERLKELMQANHGAGAAKTGKTILDDVRRHANGRPQNDDITIMVFGRRNNGSTRKHDGSLAESTEALAIPQ